MFTLSFANWLDLLWNDLKVKNPNLPELLSVEKQELLWEKVISTSEIIENPFVNLQAFANHQALVKALIETWHLSQEWCLVQKPLSLSREWLEKEYKLTIDNQLYCDWAEQYQKLCRELGYIDRDSILPLLLQAIKQGDIALPKTLDCVGFLEKTPAQQLFLGTLQDARVLVRDISLIRRETSNLAMNPEVYLEVNPEVSPQVIAFSNPREELFYIAELIKRWVVEKPKGRFAVVVPDLTTRRQMVLQIFGQVFSQSANRQQNNFTISLPIALLEYPLIASAFLGLSLLQEDEMGDIKIETLSRFLRSRFFCHSHDELSARAMMDILLHERGEKRISLKELILVLETYQKQQQQKSQNQKKNQNQNQNHQKEALNVGYQTLLEIFLALSAIKTNKQRSTEWTILFDQILTILQWQKHYPQDELNEQLNLQWKKILEDYQKLDSILGEHSFLEAYNRLKRLANLKLFLPVLPGLSVYPENTNPPVQILGVLEAAGLPFDGICVIGLDRETWPETSNPNPFIPIRLQRLLNIPHSSNARELWVAENVLDALCQGGDTVILSHALSKDGNPLRPSSLLNRYPRTTLQALGLQEKQVFLTGIQEKTQKSQQNSKKSTIDNHSYSLQLQGHGPTLSMQETATRKGGTNILRLQSACPFRAFAEIRLQAKSIPEISLGLSLAVRGEIVHEILFEFWQIVKTSNNLKKLTIDVIQNQIQSIIKAILDRWQGLYPRILTIQYRQLEEKRLGQLIMRFIELEKTRAEFEVIEGEILQVVEIGPLKIRIRLDRIDKLEDGSEVLIDYKTGKTSISDWFGERPKDPQLPIYSITRKTPPIGFLVANLRAENIQFIGLSDNNHIFNVKIGVTGKNRINEVKTGIRDLSQTKRYGSEDNFAAQLGLWKTILEKLAQDFYDGVAEVDPRDRDVCSSCSLPMLCRVNQ